MKLDIYRTSARARLVFTFKFLGIVFNSNHNQTQKETWPHVYISVFYFLQKKLDIKIMKKFKLYPKKSRIIERLMSHQSLLKSNSKVCQISLHPYANHNLIKGNILPTYFSVSHHSQGSVFHFHLLNVSQQWSAK